MDLHENFQDEIRVNKELVIGDRVYRFWTMPPTEGIPIAVSVFKLFGDSITALLKKQKKSQSQDDEERIATFFIYLLGHCEINSLFPILRSVFKYVRCNGENINIDTHFVGKNKELLNVFIYALVFNFYDFLSQSLLSFLIQKMPL